MADITSTLSTKYRSVPNHRTGRPSKYTPKTMLPTVIALMREGASKTEVAAELGISRETLYEWCNVYSDFSDTIKRGVLLSQAWWEKQGRYNLNNRSFNYPGWYMNMKNRFGWSDTRKFKPEDEETIMVQPVYVMGSVTGDEPLSKKD